MMNCLHANFLSPSHPVITPKKDPCKINNLSPFNIFSSAKQNHNTSLEEAWALRVKQIQKESDPNFNTNQHFSPIIITKSTTSGEELNQQVEPITPFNNDHHHHQGLLDNLKYPNLQTPTPFRKHLSDDVEHYKKHMNLYEHTPFNTNNNNNNGHWTPLMHPHCFNEEKPIVISSPSKPSNTPLLTKSLVGKKNPPRSNCETTTETTTNNFSKYEHYSPLLLKETKLNQGKDNCRLKKSILKVKSNNMGSTTQVLEQIQSSKSIACELLHNGFLENAVEKALECKQLIAKFIGSFNEDLIYIFIVLGECFTHLTKFKEAQQYLLEAKKIVDGLFKSKKNTRALALFSIQIYNDLGYLMKLQGKYKQSIENYRKHLDIKLQYYNVHTNEIATAYTQLGVVYCLVGSFESSMDCLKRALAIREVVFGNDHLETATVFNNIGNVYLFIGDFHRAYQYYRLGEGILECKDMIDHPDYATNLVNLATCLKSLTQTEEAIVLYEKALNIRERILGERHSSTVSCYLMIGSLYTSIHEFEKAEEYLNHGTLIREEELGKNHVETAVCYVYIGHLRCERNNFEEALNFYYRAKEIFLENYGEHHPETVMIYENISSLLVSVGKCVEALSLLQKVYQFKQLLYGENHPSTGTVLNNIGNVLRQQGRNDEAFEMYQKCRLIYERSFGLDHESIAVVYTNLGHLYYSSHLNNNKQRTDEKMVKDFVFHNAPDESKTSTLESTINEALRLYTQAKSIRERIFGTHHIETIISYRNISLVYSSMKNYTLAYQFICNCKKLLTLHHANNEDELKETSRVMAHILRESGGKVKRANLTENASSMTSLKTTQAINNNERSLSSLLMRSKSKIPSVTRSILKSSGSSGSNNHISTR